MPKALLPVGQVPAIEHCLREIGSAGFTRAVVLTSSEVSMAVGRHLASAMASAAAPWPGLAVSVAQIGWTLGMRAVFDFARLQVSDQPFAVILPDEILPGPPKTLRALVDASARYEASAVAVRHDGLPPVFRLKEVAARGSAGSEFPATRQPLMLGRYVFRPAAHRAIDALAARTTGELSLAEIVGELTATSPVVGVCSAGPYWDIGTLPGYLRAAAAFADADQVSVADLCG